MEWILFIDSSTYSLKVVLLHIGNEKSSLSIAYECHDKETYHNQKNLMGKLWYANHSWKICANLNVVAMLLGIKSGYCFLSF